ncbi:MAG: class I SAM-dependent methyltransferase [Blastocatellales bacterium]
MSLINKLFSGFFSSKIVGSGSSRQNVTDSAELSDFRLPGPQTFEVLSGLDKKAILSRYATASLPVLSYATVRDFCDSADHLHKLMLFNGDLKDVQRPWALKAVLASVPSGSRIIEIGAGEPLVASALAEIGYDVTVVDPYEGAGNGPVEYGHYVYKFKKVNIIKDVFGSKLPFDPASFDAVYSVSVIEHVPPENLPDLFAAIKMFLRPGGYSIHCVDSVIEGNDTDFHYNQLKIILREQSKLMNPSVEPDENSYDRLLVQLRDDLETFYLSALGHHVWRGGISYDQFPFRKVISVQSCVTKSDD